MVLGKNVDTLRRRLSGWVNDFREDESGATAIEYGLIVALIFLAIVASVRSFTNSASEMYGTIDAAMDNE
jgi:pilus assembly protein Flp/PilA